MNHGVTAEPAIGELRVSLFSVEFFVSPYAIYELLRSRDPVHWSDETERWILTRYEDVAGVLRGSEFTTQAKHRGLFRNGFTYMDGRDHARVRKLINPYFRPEIGKRMRERLATEADELLRRAADAQAIDFVTDVANPVSIGVVTELLGLPAVDGALLARWTAEITAAKGLATTQEAKLRAVESFQVMTRYIREFLDDFPSTSREDHVVSELIRAQKRRVLTEDELSTTVMLLIMAAIETTSSLLSSGLLALLKNPVEIGKLIENPSLVRNAVEEMLRYEAPAQFINRIARQDMEIRGRKIRAGQSLLPFIGAANRDPSEFPDPDAFRIERPNAIRHLSFGGGAHHCTGASLAREVSGVVFERLIPYLPRIRSTRQAEHWQSQALMFRRLESFQVELGPAS